MLEGSIEFTINDFRLLPRPVAISMSTLNPADSINWTALFLTKKRRWLLSRIPASVYVHSCLNNNGNKTE